MNNILIITAHPSSHNLTKGITKIYQEEYGKNVEKLFASVKTFVQ